MTRFSKLIATLFHPLLMPVYATFILLNSNTWMSFAVFPQLKNALYIIIFSSTWLMPVMTSLLLLKKGIIRSLEMEGRSERHLPFILTLLFYTAGWIVLNKLPVPRLFGHVIAGAGLAILCAFIINLRWKISIHMIGLGGLTGMLYAIANLYNFDLTIPIIVAISIAGITGTARLLANAHIPSQIYAGFVSGFVLEYIYIVLC